MQVKINFSLVFVAGIMIETHVSSLWLQVIWNFRLYFTLKIYASLNSICYRLAMNELTLVGVVCNSNSKGIKTYFYQSGYWINYFMKRKFLELLIEENSILYRKQLHKCRNFLFLGCVCVCLYERCLLYNFTVKAFSVW